MSDPHDPLADILFVPLPEAVRDELVDHPLGAREILVPIQRDTDEQRAEGGEISWEMVLAGMLRVLAYDPDHDDATWYRAFIAEARPDIVSELAETGILAARNGDFAQAEEVFRALWGLAPDRYEGPVNLAAMWDQQADALRHNGHDEAAAHLREQSADLYDELLARDDDLPAGLFLNAGLCSLAMKDFERARNRLAQFVAMKPEDAEQRARAESVIAEIDAQGVRDDLFRSAYRAITGGDEETGIELAEQFLDEHPESWNGWFLLGWARRRLELWGDALPAFERALERGGDAESDTWNEYAICLIETGDFAAASSALRRALEADPENGKVLSNFAVLELRRGNVPEARRYLETTLALAPDDAVAAELLRNLPDSD